MPRMLTILCASSALWALGLLPAVGQESKTTSKAPRKSTAKATVPGGVAGHVKSVDAEKKTLTIVAEDGAERTYSIDDKTTMVGPRGGKVPRRLRDPRFRQEGMGLIVVPEGTRAKEIHLGTRRRAATATAKAKSASKSKAASAGAAATTKRAPAPAGEPEKAGASSKSQRGSSNQVPGKVKSYDAQRHRLVVALPSGQDRSFVLSKEVKVSVKGQPSTSGLSDPAIKADAAVEVLVHPGTVRKVDEIRIDHPSGSAGPKAKAQP